MAKILVVGSFVMDNVAEMESFPEAGETVLGKSLHLYPGGKGINQCIAAVRLGGDVEMAGMLGKDANGEAFRKILEEEGVPFGNVFSCDLPTGVAQVQTDGTGQNRICVIPSANHAFDFSCLDGIDGSLRRAEFVLLQLELRTDVMGELIRRAHSYGVKVLLNPAPAFPLGRDTLKQVDVLLPNETELAVLSGKRTPEETEEESARRLLDLGVGCVVATLGDKGALIADKTGCRRVPGFRVKAVDTVAAGDSFCGALAVALSEGTDMDSAVRFANGMGALTVQTKGAIPSLRTRAELEAFLKREEKNDP